MRRFLHTVSIVLALFTASLAVTQPAAAESEALDHLLDRTGASVTQFLDQLGYVTCNEDVLQEKFNPKGKTQERLQSSFEYLVMTQDQGSEPMLFESRQAIREGRAKKNIPLLVSSGFATQLMIFHPYYQPSFTFERLPDVRTKGKSYAQVHFQHVKGRPSPAVLLLRGREYPLPIAGVALIDPATGTIERITTELGSSMEDLGLLSYRSEVEYAQVPFTREAKTYWLPAQATIEVNTLRQHWKNVHHFTNYHLFSVNVVQDVDTKNIKQKDQ